MFIKIIDLYTNIVAVETITISVMIITVITVVLISIATFSIMIITFIVIKGCKYQTQNRLSSISRR